MRKFSKVSGLTVVLALLALATLVGPLSAGSQDFTLVNATGVTIVEFYIAPSATDNWEEDVLGVDMLATGDSVDISFSPTEDAEEWDMRTVDSDGDVVVWRGLLLNNLVQVTLGYTAANEPVAKLE